MTWHSGQMNSCSGQKYNDVHIVFAPAELAFFTKGAPAWSVKSTGTAQRKYGPTLNKGRLSLA